MNKLGLRQVWLGQHLEVQRIGMVQTQQIPI